MSFLKLYKKAVFNTFLKNQYIICTFDSLPVSHVLVLTVLSHCYGSTYHVSYYIMIILFTAAAVSLSLKFPEEVGIRYSRFLKAHSSLDIFEEFCGDSLQVIKRTTPISCKIIIKRAFKKIFNIFFIVLFLEYFLHISSFNKHNRYLIEKYMNNGIHPSGEPFYSVLAGKSVVEKCFQFWFSF